MNEGGGALGLPEVTSTKLRVSPSLHHNNLSHGGSSVVYTANTVAFYSQDLQTFHDVPCRDKCDIGQVWICNPNKDSGYPVLVVGLSTGVQFWNFAGMRLLHFSANDSGYFGAGTPTVGGICSCSSKKMMFVLTGSSSGSVSIFEVYGDTVTFVQKGKGTLEAPITCVGCADETDDEGMLVAVSGDEDGGLDMWHASPTDAEMSCIFHTQYKGDCCTSIRLYKNMACCAFGSGIVRIFDTVKKQLYADISIHCRWINAIDVNKQRGLLVTAGEDGCVTVFQLPENTEGDVTFMGSRIVPNQIFTGVAFLHDEAFATVAYDSNFLRVFSCDT